MPQNPCFIGYFTSQARHVFLWNMNKTAKITSLFLVALTALVFIIDMVKHPEGPLPPLQPVLSAQATQHLLYGDQRGGGHLHGVGKPCKSEFPQDWDKDEVITYVKKVAANDNLDWKEQNNGYYVAEQMVENTRVRVVLNQTRTKIVTAYPTNVKRNPCPANNNRKPANDNNRDGD